MIIIDCYVKDNVRYLEEKSFMNSKYIRIILSFLLMIALVISLVSCGEKPAVQTESPSPSGSPVPEAQM